MAIGEADSKDERLRGLLLQDNEKKSCVSVGELRPALRQVFLTPYDLFSVLSDFSFSMPGGWNDQDLAVFLESCWENIEDLRKQNVDDNSKWKNIVEAGSRKSSNPTLFTINSCMEVAQCIKSYVIYNENRLSNNESFKKFHNDVINLLPYFPPVTIVGSRSTVNRSLSSPAGGISEHMNGDDVLENTLSQLILQNMSVIQEGSSSIWEKLSKTIHDRIAFNTDVQLFLELTKRKIISLVGKEKDIQRKKEVFFRKAKHYMVEVFDYIAPLSVKKSDILPPIDNDGSGGDVLTRKRGLGESVADANVEKEDVCPILLSENIPVSKKIKKICDLERADQISEPSKPEKCERVPHTDSVFAQEDVSNSLINVLNIESNHEVKLLESDRNPEKNVSGEVQRPLVEPVSGASDDTVSSSLEEPEVSPSEEPAVSHSLKELSTGKKKRKVKEKEKPSRELPPRSARPKSIMKIKQKDRNNYTIDRCNKADGMETKETRKKVNTRKRHELEKIPRESFIKVDEHKDRETSLRVIQKVTTTHETILRTSTTLSHSETSTNSQSKPSLRSQKPQSNTHFVNKRIITEEKVTTVVEAARFLKKEPIVKLIDICKDSNFEWPVQSQCTITTSDLSSNSNGVTVTKFKAEEISVTSIPKRKQSLVVESTRESCPKINSSKLDSRRSGRGNKKTKSHRISQNTAKSKAFIKTVVKPYNYETASEISKGRNNRPVRNRNWQSSVRGNSLESSNSEQIEESSSRNMLSNHSLVLTNPQSELNLCPVIGLQHPRTKIKSLEGNSKLNPSLTMLRKQWDEIHRGESTDMKSVSVEGFFTRQIDHNDDYWFQRYFHDYNKRSGWRFQEMVNEHEAMIAEERTDVEGFRTLLSSLKNDIYLLKNGLEC